MKRHTEAEKGKLGKELQQTSAEVSKRPGRKNIRYIILGIGMFLVLPSFIWSPLIVLPVGIILGIWLLRTGRRRAGGCMLIYTLLLLPITFVFWLCLSLIIHFLTPPEYARARRYEAVLNLTTIRMCQENYFAKNGTYVECKPSPPGGGTDSTPDEWIDAGGFGTAGFEPEGMVRFQYAVRVSKDGQSYIAIALGDVDDDGHTCALLVDTSSDEYPKAMKDAGAYSDGDDY